eukprot:scpid36672/ scgid10634/ 
MFRKCRMPVNLNSCCLDGSARLVQQNARAFGRRPCLSRPTIHGHSMVNNSPGSTLADIVSVDVLPPSQPSKLTMFATAVLVYLDTRGICAMRPRELPVSQRTGGKHCQRRCRRFRSAGGLKVHTCSPTGSSQQPSDLVDLASHLALQHKHCCSFRCPPCDRCF